MKRENSIVVICVFSKYLILVPFHSTKKRGGLRCAHLVPGSDKTTIEDEQQQNLHAEMYITDTTHPFPNPCGPVGADEPKKGVYLIKYTPHGIL